MEHQGKNWGSEKEGIRHWQKRHLLVLPSKENFGLDADFGVGGKAVKESSLTSYWEDPYRLVSNDVIMAASRRLQRKRYRAEKRGKADGGGEIHFKPERGDDFCGGGEKK